MWLLVIPIKWLRCEWTRDIAANLAPRLRTTAISSSWSTSVSPLLYSLKKCTSTVSSRRLVAVSPLDVPPSHRLVIMLSCHLIILSYCRPCRPLTAPPSCRPIAPAGCCVASRCAAVPSSRCAALLCGGGRGGRRGRFPKRNKASAPRKTGEVGACKDLDGNVFTIGSGNKGKDGDLLRTSKEKLALYIGTNYRDNACQ